MRENVILGFMVVTFILLGQMTMWPAPRPAPRSAPLPMPSSRPTGSLPTRTMIVYNRLPKTSSETFMEYFKSCPHVGHHEFGLKQPKVTYFNLKVAAKRVANEARKLLTTHEGNVVLTGHFLWTNLNFCRNSYL